jgi:hypothetical protein
MLSAMDLLDLHQHAWTEPRRGPAAELSELSLMAQAATLVATEAPVA